MSREVKELGFEIQALRLELQVLKLRVERQEAEIAELKAVQGFEFVQAPLEEGASSERVPSEPSFSSQAAQSLPLPARLVLEILQALIGLTV